MNNVVDIHTRQEPATAVCAESHDDARRAHEKRAGDALRRVLSDVKLHDGKRRAVNVEITLTKKYGGRALHGGLKHVSGTNSHAIIGGTHVPLISIAYVGTVKVD